ncbi:MAG: B12-binding domain-containing radical SAM protein [Candidatus Aenigmarchaeota archaeon]|nr:B12-binding domain-containing radical SAM protein [Candidatus Aenigmarchaeota archaeon]
MARGLLISYPGYPYTPSSLLPDNGLANLAGALIEAGHEVQVLDYGTVDTMRRLVPQGLRRKLSEIYDQVSRARNDCMSGLRGLYLLSRLHFADGRLAGYRAREVMRIAEEIAQVIQKRKPDFVGFKLWNGDGFSGPVMIAEFLKRRFPELKIFAGGPHVDFFRGLIFERTKAFDGLVYGEGEETIVQIADCVSGLCKLELPNLITPDGIERQIKRIGDLDGLPMPVYDENVYPSMKGNGKIKIVVLDESRGCPYGCAFCVQSVKSGHERRVKTAARIVGEMKRIRDHNGIRSFRYAGSSTPSTLMREVAIKIMEEDLKVNYCSYGHVREFCSEDAKALKESGLFGLLFGIESGSQGVLDLMNKPTTIEQIRTAVKAAKVAGIFVVGSVILPAPGDDKDTMNETFELLCDIRPDSVFIQFPGVYPRTPWVENPEKYGFDLDAENYCRQVMDYKIKTLFPPSFWSPLPYRLNGMRFRKFARITEQFALKLERNGLVTQLTDDIAMVGSVLGMEPMGFKQVTARAMWTGDWEKMAEVVSEFNEKSSCKSQKK